MRVKSVPLEAETFPTLTEEELDSVTGGTTPRFTVGKVTSDSRNIVAPSKYEGTVSANSLST
jgi:bacteriocin-like protein